MISYKIEFAYVANLPYWYGGVSNRIFDPLDRIESQLQRLEVRLEQYKKDIKQEREILLLALNKQKQKITEEISGDYPDYEILTAKSQIEVDKKIKEAAKINRAVSRKIKKKALNTNIPE